MTAATHTTSAARLLTAELHDARARLRAAQWEVWRIETALSCLGVDLDPDKPEPKPPNYARAADIDWMGEGRAAADGGAWTTT